MLCRNLFIVVSMKVNLTFTEAVFLKCKRKVIRAFYMPLFLFAVIKCFRGKDFEHVESVEEGAVPNVICEYFIRKNSHAFFHNFKFVGALMSNISFKTTSKSKFSPLFGLIPYRQTQTIINVYLPPESDT